MKSLIKYFTLLFSLSLLISCSPHATAQKSKKKKRAPKEVKGHDGLVKGAAPSGPNAERQFVLSRQQAMTQAKQNGYSTGSAYSGVNNQYESGKGRFSMRAYTNKNAEKKKKKKSKKIVDQENPNGKMYKEGVKKRKRKFLFF
ncbi:hypothetical protein [Rufibacter roseus]|uniref:Lipoprotein n=1 Tax=Rufibacter roseus TaxID=1567108 RepID=A0ABW2DKK9_9BACT|nr:hypothetical protein [Rufibacter roseus]